MLDSYLITNLFQLSLTDEWVRSYMSGKDSDIYKPKGNNMENIINSMVSFKSKPREEQFLTD